MALGAKACGGPTDYVVYSIVHTDSTGLQALADEYTRLNRQYNEKTGMASTCDVVLRPTLFREGGLCVGLSGVTRQIPDTAINPRPIP